ncbi:hypothetical protein GCM10027432_14270 [Lysobacter fragariae]
MLAAAPFAGRVQAAEPPTSAEVSVEDVRFQRYGVEDGLSQASVKAIMQDAQGYVWIGTQDGLNRFDGYEFLTYRNDPQDPGSLPDNHIQALEPSRRGGFWVGTLAGGVARFVPGQGSFIRYSADSRPGALASDGISTLREAPDGTLWVALASGQLQAKRAGSESFESVPDTITERLGVVTSIEPIGDELMLGSVTGLWLLHKDGKQVRRWTHDDGPAEIEAIETTPDGDDVWVGTHGTGLYRFDRAGRQLGHWDMADGLPDPWVRDLQFDADGQLWIATFDGLARLDRPDARFRVWRFGAGLAGTLASSRVHSLMLDRDGLVWIGTWLNGFSLYVPATRTFAEIQVKAQGARGGYGIAVWSVDVGEDGSVWLGVAESMGLVHYDLRTGAVQQFQGDPGNPRALPDRRVAHTVHDALGRRWVGTGNGLARREGDHFVTYAHDPDDPTSLPDNKIRRLFEDRGGTLWVGTMSGDLAALCATCSRFKRYPIMDKSIVRRTGGDAAIEMMYADRKGQLWIGGILDGLRRLDPRTGKVDVFPGKPGVPGALSHDTVTAIVEDLRGRLWVGTQGGGLNLMEFDAAGRAHFTSFGVHEGLPSNAIGGIEVDDEGKLWISTTVGVSHFDPDTRRFTNYGPSAGAQVTGYFIGAFGKLPDGRILFGGMRGVTMFDPHQVRAFPAPRRVVVTDFRLLGGKGRALRGVAAHGKNGEGWILPPDSDDISVSFSALNYADPDGLVYAYRMVGIDDAWIDVDARRRVASYNDLPAGDYTFQARARRPDGKWGDTLSIPIRRTPHWWETGWAIAAYVLIALLVLAGIVLAVRQRLAERERAQREIADSEQRLKLALWGTGDELWDWDLAHDRLRRQNPLDEPDSIGEERIESVSQLREAVHPDDRTLFDDALASHMIGDQEFIDVSYRVRDHAGYWRWRLSRGRVVARDAGGQPLRIVGTNSDITGLKENEVELARVNTELESRVHQRTEALYSSNENLRHTIDELRQTQQQLVDAEKMAALGNLVAGVAHEINTPLGVGVTAASHLEGEARKLGRRIDEGTLDRPALDQFRQMATESSQLILRNLQRADRMVKSFRQVAVDQSSEEIRRFDLRTYVDEILLSLQPSLRQQRHTVSVVCPQPIEVETYPGAIYQIVANLMMNSVMHGFAGRDNGQMRLSLTVEDGIVVVDYRDNGAGLSDEARRHVFEPFFTTRRGSGGSGLGMHITWNLATQLLGGSISCEETHGEGARFVLRFPLKVRRSG